MSYSRYGVPQLGTRIWPTRNFDTTQIPDLIGKTAGITGGTSGIGLESAVQLATKGADVYILGSSPTKGEQATTHVKQATGKTVTYTPLNLASIKDSQKAAAELRGKVDRIDILLLNAGANASTAVSEDGYEMIFAVNHLLHPYSQLGTKPPSESKSFGDLVLEQNERYGVSKLANILFARALQRRVGEGVFVNVLHPCLIKTSLLDAKDDSFSSVGALRGVVGWLVKFVFGNVGLSVQDGALTQLFLCTSPKVVEGKHKGDFWVPIAVADITVKAAEDVGLQEELWTWSEEAVAKA